MSSLPAVRAEALTRRFGGFTAVDRISFEIGSGEIWGFLGPNGSGKSTTIRMLCGVLAPSAGRAQVLGYDVASDPEAVKLRIGYMSQGSTLWNDLTVEEHLQFYAGLFGLYGVERRSIIEEWLERVGLVERRQELAGALPGGFRKRLGLACALIHTPQMVFLDEPTSGVDPLSRREFWDLIVGLAEGGTTVMVTTHYLDEAEHCDRLAFIFHGRIIASGSPEELKRTAAAGLTIEVVSIRNVALLDELDVLPYVRSASLFGSALHVTVDGRADLDRLQGFLRGKGLEADALQPITPSLEDVFATLVKRSENLASEIA